MARIPEFTPQARINVPGAPNLPAGVRVPAIGGAEAQGEGYAAGALTRLGGAVSAFGQDVSAYEEQQRQEAERKQAEADQAELANLQAQTAIDLTTIDAETKQASLGGPAQAVGGAGVMPARPPTSLADQTKSAYDRYRDGVLKKVTSPRLKEAYSRWFLGVSTKGRLNAMAFDLQRLDAKKATDVNDALTKNRQIVGADPSQFDEAWARSDAILSTAAQWMDPADYAKLREDTRSRLELTRAQTLARTNPLYFQQEVTPHPGNEGPENPRKRSGGFAENEYYSHLDPAQVASLLNSATEAVVTQHNQAIASQEAERKGRVDQLKVALHDGTADQSSIWEARRSGTLKTYDEIKDVEKIIEDRQKQAMDTAKAWTLFKTDHQFSFANADDKKAVDLVYNQMVDPSALLGDNTGPGAGLSAGGDPQQVAIGRTREVINQTGIVPQSVVETLRGGLVSRDKGTLVKAYTVLDGLYRENPAAVRNAFPAEDLRRMDIYERLAPIVPPEELLARLDPTADPKTNALRETLEGQGRTLAAKITISDLLGHFESSLPFDAASQPVDGVQTQAFLSDFQEAYAVAYSKVPDQTKAKEIALTWITREKWGVTQIGSDRRLIAYPPEQHYDQVDGSHDWLDDQTEEVVKAQFSDAQGWGVAPSPETEGKLNDSPPYYVWVIDHDGALKYVTSPDWQGRPAPVRFDRQAAINASIERHKAVRGSLIPAPGSPAYERQQKVQKVLRGNQFDPDLQYKLLQGQ